MIKHNFGDSFSVNDIRKLRDYLYEKNKNLSSEALIKNINKTANKFKKKNLNSKKETISL